MTEGRAGGRGIGTGHAAGVLALLAAGCMARPAERTDRLLAEAWPRVEAPPSTALPQVEAGDATAEPGEWTLERILARVRAANPNVAVAEARLDAARAARAEADATRLPELSFGYGVVSTDEPAQAFGLLLDQEDLSLGPGFDPTPPRLENWRKEARVDWTLFAPGRAEQRGAAREREDAADLGREAIERRLQNAGVQAWIGLRAARALEAVARESVGVVEERLKITRTRQQEGVALKVDVQRLEVRLAQARDGAARAGLAVRRAESSLNELLGRRSDAPLTLADETVAIGTDLPAGLDDLLERAERERRDLRAAALAVRVAQDEGAAAKASRLPALVGFAAYDVDGPEPGIETDLSSSTLGLALRLGVSPTTGARVRRTRAQEREARAALQALALSVAREVRDARDARAVSEETVRLAETAVGASEEAYRVVSAAQDAGGATVTDVLEAEDARREARVRLVAARAAVELATARLAAATGGIR